MTNEEKKLLLIDLCARLPYGVIVSKKPINESFTWKELQDFQYGKIYKPYLRSIHKLTKKELEELEFLTDSDYVDYCNEHHIDYRNLIPKGLALEAPEDIYKN